MKCLCSCRDDFQENLGKITAQRMQKNSLPVTCFAQKRLCLNFLLGSLSKGGFERRMPTGSKVFFILKHLDAIKFVSLSVFTITETIFAQLCAKPLSKKEKKDHLRLTCVAQLNVFV